MNRELRNELSNIYGEELIVFDNPEFDKAIVGVTTDNRVVYNYRAMAEYFASVNKCDVVEAMEFIDFNTIRALPYMGGYAPVIMFDIEDMI